MGSQEVFRSCAIHWSAGISRVLGEAEADVGAKQLGERWEVL